MKHTLGYLLLMVQFIYCQISTKQDNFVGVGKRILQKFVDDNGKEWNRDVSPMKLELLANDKLLLKDQKSCIEVANTFSTGDTVKTNVTQIFEEIAKVRLKFSFYFISK